MCKKLQGRAAGNVSWCTNVGNEREEVLYLCFDRVRGAGRPSSYGHRINRKVHVVNYCLSYCATHQIPEGKAGSYTTDVHRQRLLLCQWAVKVCSAVRGLGSPAS